MYFMTLKYFYKMSIFKENIEKEIISLKRDCLYYFMFLLLVMETHKYTMHSYKIVAFIYEYLLKTSSLQGAIF